MTSSVLSTHTQGYLNEYDLQVLSDFALEAPWEWRNAFERLLDDAQRAQEVEGLQNDIIDLRDEVSSQRATLEEYLKKYKKELKGDMLEDLNDILVALEKAAK